MKNRNWAWLVIALIFGSLFGFSRTAAHAQNAAVANFLKSQMQELRIPGLQVAVVKQGKMVFLQAYGTGYLPDSVAVDDKSIFAINSCTKAFTGVAIMQLVEDGKINLAAPVGRYLDSLPADWQKITIRQLLTHVSGLPDNLDLNVGEEEAAVWAKVKIMPLEFPTGEQFSYNQTNYALLGKIITKLSGQPFTQMFQERQFNVVPMPGTVFADSRNVIPRLVPTYRYVTHLDGQNFSSGKLTPYYSQFPPYNRTGSGLNSTAEDIAHWLIALQQGKLLKNKTSLQTLWTAGTYNNGSPTQWALGWVTKPGAKHRAVIATGGGRSAFFVYPEDDLAVVVLTNLAGAFPENFIHELAGFYNPGIPLADPITALRMQLRKRGFENAVPVYRELVRQDANFRAAEVDLNDWGYRLLSNQQLKEAKEIFKLTVALYPTSWNAYDSYGESLLKLGEKKEAIHMYQKSVTLHPENENGKKILAELLKAKK